MAEKNERLNLTFHPENDKEMRALQHILKRSNATGLTRSQYVVDCILRCEEGGATTLTRDEIVSIVSEAVKSAGGQKSTGYDSLESGMDFGGYT
ncbi:MAG: hypothetical protein IKI12_02710 [Lachnospiraceae bacterium]|nr:hypothetical protein [Lachnospiraceae bacterium]